MSFLFIIIADDDDEETASSFDALMTSLEKTFLYND